jgi:hypothetical protein
MVHKEAGMPPPEEYNLPDLMTPELLVELNGQSLDQARVVQVALTSTAPSYERITSLFSAD